ncbi:hypothetical protein ACWGLP_30295 [Streptomyces lydicus]
MNALGDDIDVKRIPSNLRIGISGGAALPMETAHQIKQRLGITVLEGYGAAYKYPRIVEFVRSLPMTATGKILKRELARRTEQ